MVGNLTGRATGWVYRTRARLSQFAEETEITKVRGNRLFSCDAYCRCIILFKDAA